MDEVIAEKPKRRRKSRASARKSASWSDYLRGREFGRHLFTGMCLLGTVYVGKIAWDTRVATFFYNSIVIGSPESEVRYMLGAPGSIDRGGSVYRYNEGGRLVTVSFSPDGSMASVTCAATEPKYASRCDRILGLGIGDTEDQVGLRLGVPSRQSYVGNDKLMHYDGMGLTFYLRRYKVYALEVHKDANLVGYLPRALWQMLP